MRKKEIIWIAVLLVLVGVYIRYFTHAFQKPQIGITVSIRPNRRAPGDTVIFFTLNNAYKLTSLKVVPLESNTFKPEAVPVWNLVSDSNSVPTRAFRYGQRIPGMKPALAGVHPDRLTPGTPYRLLLSAGEASCQIDFQAKTIGQ